MQSPKPFSPIRETDDEARVLARGLIAKARFAALGVLDPDTGAPAVSRIAIGTGPEGGIWTLVSGLSAHSRALRADPRAGLLIGEPGLKGDPLTHPRLSLSVRAHPFPPEAPGLSALRAHWLAGHPKSKLYLDLPDFFFLRFEVLSGLLNGGFARAYRLTPADME